MMKLTEEDKYQIISGVCAIELVGTPKDVVKGLEEKEGFIYQFYSLIEETEKIVNEDNFLNLIMLNIKKYLQYDVPIDVYNELCNLVGLQYRVTQKDFYIILIQFLYKWYENGLMLHIALYLLFAFTYKYYDVPIYFTERQSMAFRKAFVNQSVTKIRRMIENRTYNLRKQNNYKTGE